MHACWPADPVCLAGWEKPRTPPMLLLWQLRAVALPAPPCCCGAPPGPSSHTMPVHGMERAAEQGHEQGQQCEKETGPSAPSFCGVEQPARFAPPPPPAPAPQARARWWRASGSACTCWTGRWGSWRKRGRSSAPCWGCLTCGGWGPGEACRQMAPRHMLLHLLASPTCAAPSHCTAPLLGAPAARDWCLCASWRVAFV